MFDLSRGVSAKANVRWQLSLLPALVVFLAPVGAVRAQDLFIDVIVNGGFEAWTVGGTAPPDGWTNLDEGPATTAYVDPAQGPIGGAHSLITEGNAAGAGGSGARGQLTTQEVSMGPRWRFRADFALEDPLAGAGDQIATSFQIAHPNSGSGNAGGITVWIKDVAPDDGVAELWLRNNTGAQLNQGNIPGLGFSADILNAPVVHELVMDGHYNAASPSYDITFNLHQGGSVSFPGLQIWQTADPAQGDAPHQIRWPGPENPCQTNAKTTPLGVDFSGADWLAFTG